MIFTTTTFTILSSLYQWFYGLEKKYRIKANISQDQEGI